MLDKLISVVGSKAFGNAAPVFGSIGTGLFNQRSANKQMQFQDTSSRTQYQRAVADMKAAGLNPMLATKLGGNAAMSGASASMPDLGASISSAENLRQMRPIRDAEAKIKQLDADIKQLKDKPAAVVSGFMDRVVGQAIAVIDDYIKLTQSHGFDNGQLNQVEKLMDSLKRTSIKGFIETLNGLDKTSKSVLQGLDWFKKLIGDLR